MNRISIMLKKIPKILKNEGVGGIFVRVLQKLHLISKKADPLELYKFIMNEKIIRLNEDSYKKHKNDKVKVLNWIIPEMGEGSGGHTTIFRFVSNLEKRGFHSRIYLFQSPRFLDNKSLRRFVKAAFPILDPNVEIYYDVKYAKFAHATFATSWETAYFVRNFENTISKFYFVQDFEPYFYAHGSEYQFAENTYKFGLRGITAGDWLKEKLSTEYGMKTDSFLFSYQKEVYYPVARTDNKRRVFFYARPVTPRRDFELGLLALQEVCRRLPDVEVVFAGWDLDNYIIPFRHESLGVVSMQKLAECYNKCDMCLVISNTNLSLVPLEVMACGSVAICSKGDNSSWMVSEDNAVLVDYDPVQIANTIEYYFNNPGKLENIRKRGLEFVKDTSWEKEADKVKDVIFKAIEEDVLVK
ncbi:glycosyltransferase family 4 protein [Faecalicatena contorta]|uniref:Glycosyltransferase involved in cell wall bisynthesis n=1 Tax=Faecalicatena contorta TaxID=39482 RepID=A0A315ZTZ6_9FIRM|nr:glycosyltransferase family 4 protein [Faecalicatena contorta]PWJ48380.1 glycosyltransferase involved in cell wall biosynthesis [Faecalicatena contorta]SUQ15403.1 Glycosyltransferase involved in cell wall bisynthesis [Faecalicatena contorta]